MRYLNGSIATIGDHVIIPPEDDRPARAGVIVDFCRPPTPNDKAVAHVAVLNPGAVVLEYHPMHKLVSAFDGWNNVANACPCSCKVEADAPDNIEYAGDFCGVLDANQEIPVGGGNFRGVTIVLHV